jgi:6-phosphogluconolactonase
MATGPYEGHRRMMLTYGALRRTDRVLWLVSGTDKREILARLLQGDGTISAGQVEPRASLVIADETAVLSGART